MSPTFLPFNMLGRPELCHRHPHAIVADPSGRFVYTANRGTISQFMVGPKGAGGPLHTLGSVAAPWVEWGAESPVGIANIVIDPFRKYAYIAGARYQISVNGTLVLQASNGAAKSQIAIDHTGRYLFSTDRLVNAVFQFAIRDRGAIEPNVPEMAEAGTLPTSIITVQRH